MNDTPENPITKGHELATNSEEDLPLIIKNKAEPTPPDAKPSLTWRLFRKLRFLPLVMVFAVTFGFIGLYFQPPGLKILMNILDVEPGGGTKSPIAIPVNPRPALNETGKLPKLRSRNIVGLGKLLPEGDIRTVASPFGAGDARIEQLHVEEGDKVVAGDKLASLDNEQNIKASIENAEATIAARRAILNQIRSSVLASQDETRALLQRAKSALQNSQLEFERADKLFKRGFTTRSILDQKRSARDQAQREVERLTATLTRFLSNTIDEQPDVVVAARNVDAAISDLNRAKSDLSKSLVRAPISGTVLQIHARPGERSDGKGILSIGNIDKMTAEVEIYQTEIGAVVLGTPVELSAEALSRQLHGTVTKIGLEVGTQTLVDSSPAANTDARVVTVTVALDDASSEAAKRYTNLQILARIKVPAK
ncbi:MAG: HlyD family efflux transporter periplasmic adaptor subunit [Hyphomicrobiales bacterium]|nr:HlyD family efflux transporter periplasmic adaptor subunit [Hyphomicrobiales bacterium]